MRVGVKADVLHDGRILSELDRIAAASHPS